MSAEAVHKVDLAPPVEVLDRIGRRTTIVAAVLVVGSLIGLFLDPAQFMHSYLLGYMLWIGATLGSMAMLMLLHLTGGFWGIVIRRVFEAATRNIWLMIVLFIPIIIGAHHLYDWTKPGLVASDEHIRHLQQYLSLKWFVFRAVIYFIAWGAMIYFLNFWSSLQDTPPERELDKRFRRISGPGLVIYGFTLTFSSVDWVMSLNPHWTSTMYPLIFLAGQALLALSFAVAMEQLLVKYPPLSAALKPSQTVDQGNLMLALVMLWAYFSFSQWLIIWAGNLPDEISWYMDRLHGGWEYIALFLVFFHFAVPFALLLSRARKKVLSRLFKLALWLMFIRWVDLLFLIEPNFKNNQGHFHLSWMDVVVPAAIGAVWTFLFLRNLKQRPLLAPYDPHTSLVLEQ